MLYYGLCNGCWGALLSPALQNEGFRAGHALAWGPASPNCPLPPRGNPNPMAIDVGSTLARPPCLSSGHYPSSVAGRRPQL